MPFVNLFISALAPLFVLKVFFSSSSESAGLVPFLCFSV